MSFFAQPAKIVGMVYVVNEKASKTEECVCVKTKKLQQRQVIRTMLELLFGFCQEEPGGCRHNLSSSGTCSLGRPSEIPSHVVFWCLHNYVAEHRLLGHIQVTTALSNP